MTRISPNQPHLPVMLKEVVELLAVKPGGRYLDGTLGAGGHAAAVLDEQPTAELLGIDRDADALALARTRLEEFGGRVILRQGEYADMAKLAAEVGWKEVDGILLDLGLSSMQIDEPNRGFSYRHDGPLDMRMDRRGRTTASVIVNTATEDELTRIFREYGEEPKARLVARAIIARRETRLWERTGELAELIAAVVGRGKGRHVVPEARCFQGLRIAVNGELDQLEKGLEQAHNLLAVGGRLVIITFHSLEDRLVKQRFRYWTETCICPPAMPVCRCGKHATVTLLTRKPILPGELELSANRRAAPAKIRACEKRDISGETHPTP